jgi:hypothetical protein
MDGIRKSQRLLVGHGALVLLSAFVIGFGFLFFLIGEISLWPIPGSIDYQLPGTYDAWRMAHMEGITNGFGLWLLAAVLPLLDLSAKTSRRIAIGMIITSLTNDIAFLLFVIGIGIVVAIMCRIAYQCLFVRSKL